MTVKHLFALLPALAACGSSRVAPPPTPNGAWTVSLSVEASGRNPKAVGKKITGTIHLRPKNPAVTDTPVGRFGYYGPFSVDFRSMGGSLVGTPDTSVLLSICPNTLVVAAASAGWDDSVHVALNPCADHGRVMLDGKWRGGQIRGRWYESTTGGSSGTFTMRRASA
jgi:hypothetical protein